MKKPATTWPTAVPTSVTRVTTPSAPVLPEMPRLDLLDVAVELGVGDVERSRAQPVADLARGPRPTESARSLAPWATCWPTKVSSSATRADAEDHHEAGREAAGQPDPSQPVDQRRGQRRDEQGDRDREGDDGEEAQGPQQPERRHDDDDEAPRPGGREVEAPRHLGAAEVGRPGGDRGRLGPALGTQRAPTAGRCARSARLVLLRASAAKSRRRPDSPRGHPVRRRARGPARPSRRSRYPLAPVTSADTSRCAVTGCSSASSPAAAST